MSSWLVTGGAGYIGAHVVRALSEQDETAVVLDDLSTGEASRVGDCPLVVGSVLDADLVRRTIREHDVRGIVHIAAKKQVGESVAQPLRYYRENLVGELTLLEAAVAGGVEHFVFSSSASVYGDADADRVDEEVKGFPLSPYGESKLAGEWMARATAATGALRTIALRYFNVAGAASVALGDPGVFNLVPIAFQALTQGNAPRVFGDDYPTPDGTCIRDYIHVCDVADAHVAALRHLADGGESAAYNIGRGEGSSVLEVLRTVGEVTGIQREPEVGPRRPGDPARIVADVDKIAGELGWVATYDLQEMVGSAWEAWPARPA